MGRKSSTKQRQSSPEKEALWASQALSAFMENGIRAFNMDALAKELSVSKATLYKYFRSREEILTRGLAAFLEDLRGFVPFAPRPKPILPHALSTRTGVFLKADPGHFQCLPCGSQGSASGVVEVD